MNTITLLYAGTEKSIQDWGYTMPRRTRRSRSAGVFKLIIPNGDPAAAATIPFEAQVKIYANRTGAGTSWSGGTCIFAGRRTDRPGRAGNPRNVVMIFTDAWYDLERTPFQQLWYKQNSGDPSPTEAYYSRVYLWHDITTGGLLSSDAQIEQIIDFAATECGVLIQAGTIDPIQNYPVYPTKALSCADAINLVLRSMPDVTTSIDYTTTPPTLNVRQRAQLGSVTLPYASTDLSGGRSHLTTDIRDRPDLQAPSIILQYQINNTVDGQSLTAFSADTYGTDSTGFTLRDIVAPLDLRGSKITYLAGQLTSVAFDPTSNAFWETHKPDLADATITPNGAGGGADFVANTAINDGSRFCITVLDETGSPVDLTDYPNELDSKGHYAPWMESGSTPIVVKEVVVTAYLSYYSKDVAGVIKNHQVTKHAVSVRIKLTNSAVGTVNYLSKVVNDPGEVQPTYLAYAIWCSINNVVPNIMSGYYVPPGSIPSITNPSNLQWEGTHTVKENKITLIANDVTLNLSADPITGNAPWTAMKATIYEIEEDFFSGETRIEFGPHKNLTAEQFFEQTMLWRYRFVFDPPSMRTTGTDSCTTGPSISTDSKVQNTNHSALPSYELHTVVAPPDGSSYQAMIQHDATTNGGQIVLQQVDNTNTPVVGAAQMKLSRSDITDSNILVKFRKWPVCDNTGIEKSVWLPTSDFF